MQCKLVFKILHNPFHMNIDHSLLTCSALYILKVRMRVHEEVLGQYCRT